MADNNAKSGDILTYGQTKYRLVENRVTKGQKKKNAFIAINVISIAIMVIVFLLYSLTAIFSGTKVQIFIGDFSDIIISLISFLVLFFVFVIAHEYVHYLTYRIFGKIPKDKLKFGVVLKMGMAYCISLEPNSLKASRLSLMMPFYVLVIPVIIASLILQNGYLAFLAAMFASGSGGDIWYVWTLRKDKPSSYIIEEMPSDDGYEIGYYLLEKVE